MVVDYLFLFIGLLFFSALCVLVTSSALPNSSTMIALRHLFIPAHFMPIAESKLMQNSQHSLPVFVKSTALTLAFLFVMSGANAQNIYLTGTDICTDGTQSTEIGITDSDPAKHYALFRDGIQLMMFQQYSDQDTNPITFGTFSEPGIYRVYQFERHGSNMNPNDGIAIGDQVHIKPMPVMFIPDEPITTQSGNTFNYEPKADIRDATFTWTATVAGGKVKKFNNRGRGDISMKLELDGDKPSQVVFSITPIAPDHLGGCMGHTRDLIVNIEP